MAEVQPAQAPGTDGAGRGLGWRLAAYFASVFGLVGVTLPFWPVYLSSRGLDAAQIGLLLSTALWLKVLVNPLVAQWADRRGLRRRPMMALCLIALAGYGSVALAGGFPAILAAGVVGMVAMAAVLPLGENLVLTMVYRHGLDYGRLRLWGSVSFILVSLVVGPLLGGRGAMVILAAMLALVAAAFFACRALPPRVRATMDDGQPSAADAAPAGAPLPGLLGNRLFLLFLVTASLGQASHAVLYGFGSLTWRGAGISDGMIGWLWSEGVIAEIVLFWLGARLLERIGVAGLLALGAAAGVVRWTAYGIGVGLPALLVLQVLHAFTFGATHLGAMHFLARAVPAPWSATAQSLYTAVSGGIVMGLATMAGAALYQRVAAEAFLAMTAMCAVGLALALVLARRWDGGVLTGGPTAEERGR
ncbi:MAG TPA: MFS transporter [Alphaproteobacteria bacterium]|nr:MFS transporter [Alphaproteobacteria bacterium]